MPTEICTGQTKKTIQKESPNSVLLSRLSLLFYYHPFCLSLIFFITFFFLEKNLMKNSGQTLSYVAIFINHYVKSDRIRIFSGLYSVRCGKIRTRKTPNTDTFHIVNVSTQLVENILCALLSELSRLVQLIAVKSRYHASNYFFQLNNVKRQQSKVSLKNGCFWQFLKILQK